MAHDALLHRDAAGEMARVIGIMIDITARKRAEEEVRQSRERFQAAAGALGDSIWTNNAKGEMEGEQPGWGGFTGQTYGEYQGYGWSSAVHPEDRQPTVDAWNRAVAQRSDFAFEHRVRRHDGVWRLFAIRAVPLLDERGTIREWVGVHTDITDRRQAEEALRQSEERFRQVAESMPQVVWSTNPLGVLDYVNARWTELTGCDLAATNAGSFRRHMPAEDLAVMDAAWVKAARTGEPSSFECRFPRVADGTLRWQGRSSRSIPVRTANGEIVTWLRTLHRYRRAERRGGGCALGPSGGFGSPWMRRISVAGNWTRARGGGGARGCTMRSSAMRRRCGIGRTNGFWNMCLRRTATASTGCFGKAWRRAERGIASAGFTGRVMEPSAGSGSPVKRRWTRTACLA